MFWIGLLFIVSCVLFSISGLIEYVLSKDKDYRRWSKRSKVIDQIKGYGKEDSHEE